MTSLEGCPVPRCLSALLLLLCALNVWAAGAPTTAQQNVAAPNPTRLRVCESTDQSCLKPNPNYASEWSFDGTTGVVTSPASESGTQLTIDGMWQDKIVIRRVDPFGRNATYSGTIHGNQVTGKVERSSSTQTDASTVGSWSAIFENLPATAQSSADASSLSTQGLPVRLIECEGNGPCNGAWSFDGLNGTATWFTQSPIHAKLIIVRSDPDEITIRRTDLTDGNSAVTRARAKATLTLEQSSGAHPTIRECPRDTGRHPSRKPIATRGPTSLPQMRSASVKML